MKLLGKHSPNSVLNTLWFLNTLHFGMRGGSTEHRAMCWGDVVLKRDSDVGLDCLEYHERLTKTRTGEDIRNTRPCPPRMYATPETPNKCPVTLYMFYQSKRPDDFCNATDPFYLAAVTNEKNPDVRSRWFLRGPVGKNKLDNMMKNMAKQANLPGMERLTNTSVRKSLVQKMTDNQVPDSLQVYVTGHKNTQSLNNYRTLNDRHKYMISSMLSNTTKNTEKLPAAIGPVMTSNNTQCLQPTYAAAAGSAIQLSQENKVTTYNPVSQKRTDSCMESMFAGAYMNNCNITVNITTNAGNPKRRRIMTIESDTDSD